MFIVIVTISIIIVCMCIIIISSSSSSSSVTIIIASCLLDPVVPPKGRNGAARPAWEGVHEGQRALLPGRRHGRPQRRLPVRGYMCMCVLYM